ncbi:MAG: radical SAM protein [Candidatus Nealsonbacteria bacterium]|nr:radical SAM protein [Candidatus Nealsonbacteria bacterium]
MLKIREILCKSAIGKCGFPSGGFCINPYVGCSHRCVYCYSRFMRRFTGHQDEKWGTFVDVKMNAAEVLKKQLKSPKFKNQPIYMGTVTDPYQPLEKKYKITREVLKILLNYPARVSILTKSNLVLRDLDLLKKFRELDVNMTITSLDEKWTRLTEPFSASIKERLECLKTLHKEGITTLVLMGPYWPIFTKPEELFKEFKRVGVKYLFTESFNAIGGNWTGVEEILKKHYSQLLLKIKYTILDKDAFNNFYTEAEDKAKRLSKQYNIPCTIYFARGHAAKSTT